MVNKGSLCLVVFIFSMASQCLVTCTYTSQAVGSTEHTFERIYASTASVPRSSSVALELNEHLKLITPPPIGKTDSWQVYIKLKITGKSSDRTRSKWSNVKRVGVWQIDRAGWQIQLPTNRGVWRHDGIGAWGVDANFSHIISFISDNKG